MSLVFHSYILGLEARLQLKGWILRALQDETHMRASILNIDTRRNWYDRIPKLWAPIET
jgi:hypothetical protein